MSVVQFLMTITTTTEHPFYVKGRGFVRAGSLGIGTQIVTRAGPSATVTATRIMTRAAGYTVYNLTVDGDHTYFVGKLAGGVWVHNAELCEIFASFEQGLNRVLSITESWGLKGADKVPVIGRLKRSAGFGRQIGWQSPDNKILWRLDWDPEKGMHFNALNYAGGKGESAIKMVIQVPGDEGRYVTMLNALFPRP